VKELRYEKGDQRAKLKDIPDLCANNPKAQQGFKDESFRAASRHRRGSITKVRRAARNGIVNANGCAIARHGILYSMTTSAGEVVQPAAAVTKKQRPVFAGRCRS
jgi:hypothetical protein